MTNTSIYASLTAFLIISLMLTGPVLLQHAYSLSFKAPVNLSNNDGNSILQKIATSGSAVYIAWVDNTPGQTSVFFKRSTDGGQTFDATKRLNLASEFVNSVDIAASGKVVYVIWSANLNGDFDIFLKRSTDGGVSFETTKNLSANRGSSVVPIIKVVDSNIYLAWLDDSNQASGSYDIFFKRSTDFGISFSNVRNLSLHQGKALELQMDAEGTQVNVIWTERQQPSDSFPTTEEQSRIIFRASHDGGDTFLDSVTVANEAEAISNPLVSLDGHRNVFVLWKEAGGKEVTEALRFSTSDDEGLSFGPIINLRDASTTSHNAIIQHLVMETANRALYVVWDQCYEDETGNGDSAIVVCDVFLKRSTNGGNHFDQSTNISEDGRGYDPDLLLDGNKVYVGWKDIVPSAFSSGDVYLKISKNKGNTFGSANAITNDQTVDDPILAISNDKLLAAWADHNSGTFDVWLSSQES